MERIKNKRLWTPLNRFEQVALAGTILVWVGVLLFGIGLYITLKNMQADQHSIEQATVIAAINTAANTPTATPSPTPLIFPAGWSTATPTRTPTALATETPIVAQATLSIGATLPPATRPTETQATVAKPPTATSEPDDLGMAPLPRLPQATPTSSQLQATTPQSPDRLVIPQIKLDSKIIPVGWYVVQDGGLSYSVWQVADYAVGWHKTSAYPGQAGNVVLSGHHNIKGEVFRYLIDVEIGALVQVYAGGQVYEYTVTEKHILKEKGESDAVRRENARWIAPTSDERLTIVTCWPYSSNTHRLVVVARPVRP